MLRITELKLDIQHTPQDLRRAIIKKLRITDTGLLDFQILKQSLDCRHNARPRYVYCIDALVKQETSVLRRNKDPHITLAVQTPYRFPVPGTLPLKHRPVIIGSGPSGLFAAYLLAMKGFRPIIVERGEPAEERVKKVQRFWETGELDPESNIQFGEGGAGTFSDGKLNTGIKDVHGRKELMLRIFVEHGAPDEILFQNKPHLGTDVLVRVVSSMRRQILEWGGEYRFSSCFLEFCEEAGAVTGVRIRHGEDSYVLPADCAVLAVGHSARDTFDYLIHRSPLSVRAKPFAVGVRVEHRQAAINQAQYGGTITEGLPPADYKLTCHTSSGNSVYSFCMCPGGYVVNSSSAEGLQCINGMSYSGRHSDNANSAIVAAVMPSDDPEENIRFQVHLEQKAWQEGKGRIVSQRFEDFEAKRITSEFGSVTPVHKGLTAMGDINRILPEDICRDIREAMHLFAARISGYDDPDTILSAVESRTSSPVRILRKDSMESELSGVYPAGEGAGYAGGITSAAIDGIKIFEKICEKYAPF